MATPTRTAAIKHEGFLRHGGYRWLKVATVLSVAAMAVYVLVDVQPRPNGGSWIGYTLGTVGAALIVWLTALGVRKRAMTPGRWSLKAWTSAHVYLGASLIVIGTLHTGFQFGWNIHTAAYALMMLVIASGVFGVIAYARLPRRLSENRAELTEGQMLEQIRSLDRDLNRAAQPLGQARAEIVRLSLEETKLGGGFTRRLGGVYADCGNRRALAKARGDPALEQVAGLLTRKEAALARARRHIRLRALLEVWLYVHVPATIALLVALTAHIVSVFFYW
ncbi:MAG TPA: hypothetical protein VFX95_04675 [Caulobacteraceae bacterium]|nr:hypothetical protein [Caulobacteraceae bacterium]